MKSKIKSHLDIIEKELDELAKILGKYGFDRNLEVFSTNCGVRLTKEDGIFEVECLEVEIKPQEVAK